MTFLVFAMAKIQRIGNDYQAACWHLLVVGNQAVTRGKNKPPHAQYTLNPKYFLTESESHIKLLLGRLIRSAPTLLTPLLGEEVFF